MFDNLGKAVLWWSSGIDSTLLLAMLMEADVKVDILHLRDKLTPTKRANAMIKKWGLKTFSYPPASVSLIQDKEIAVVSEYAIGGGFIPLIRDVVDGTACIAELNGHRLATAPFEWDTCLVGSRRDDTHWALGELVPAKEWYVGNTRFYAPLYEWSKEEVIARSQEYGLDIDRDEDEGDVALCTKCLQGVEVYCPLEKKVIPPVQWDGRENLRLFQQSYG